MLNHMILQGRLVRDSEMRTTQSGSSVVSFTVAWSEKYKENEKQLFLDCTAWSGTAELVDKYFAKGKEIAVEGKLYTEKWEDKEGNKRSSIKMNVERVHFCGSKSDGDSSGYSGGSDYGDSSGRAPAAKGGIGVEGPEGEGGGDLPF